MAVTLSNLIPGVLLAAAQTTQYTSTGVTTIIDKFTLDNTSAAAVDVTINLVPSGGAAGVANQVLKKTLQANETYTCPEIVNHVLGVGGFVSVLASTANVVSLRSSGRLSS